MKKLFVLILSFSLCLSLSACTSGEADYSVSQDTRKVFQAGDYPIWVTTPSDWKKESDPDSFDLQCRSPKKDMYLSVFGFSALDLSDDPQDLFELQTNEIMSLRDNATEIEPITSTEDDEKTLFTSLYSGEHNGAKYYYRFFFIHFKSTGDMAWISFNGMPSVVENNSEVIDEIISTVQNSDPEMEEKQ